MIFVGRIPLLCGFQWWKLVDFFFCSLFSGFCFFGIVVLCYGAFDS